MWINLNTEKSRNVTITNPQTTVRFRISFL